MSENPRDNKRTPSRTIRFDRRAALKLLPVGGVAAVAAGYGVSRLAIANPVVTPTECRFCVMHCGMLVTSRGDEVISVVGDQKSQTKGFLCEHGKALPDVVHAKARLRTPLIKKGDAFVPSTWEQAYAFIADKLKQVKAEHGPESLVVQTGWPFVRHPMIHLLHRFCRAFGSPNLATVASLCEASGRMGRALVWGSNYSPDLFKVNSIFVWGANPTRTAPPWAHLVTNVKKRGGKLVVIDVEHREIADAADLVLLVRPGTDGAVASAMIKHITDNGWHDKQFVEANCVGAAELIAACQEWTPKRAAEVAGVSEDAIKQAAEIFARSGPTGVWDGLGIEHHARGVDTVRLVSSLIALCGFEKGQGFFDKPQGGKQDGKLDVGDALPMVLDVQQQQPIPPEPKARPVGAAEYELFCAVHRQAQASLLPRAMSEGTPYPVRALIVFGANPAVTTPDSAAVRKGYDKLDLLVVVDPFLSETAELADVVLPAATFAEQPPVPQRGRQQKLDDDNSPVSPQGDARPDDVILFQLARAIGLAEFFPWQNMREAFAAGGRQNVVDAWAKDKLQAKTTGSYFTASGKIELASTVLPLFGLPAVPVVDVPTGDGKEGEGFPLRLVSGPRQRSYINSQFHDVPRIAAIVPEPIAEVHTETAAQAGVKDGDRVVVETAFGKASFVLRASASVAVGVVVVPAGWQREANANRMTTAERLDPVSGFPRLRSLRCRITVA